MMRREFIAGLGSAAAWPVVTRAQQSTMPVVGYIGSDVVASRSLEAAFLKGLGEVGYVEGRNVVIEYRWVQSHNERLPAFVSDLVSRRVAVITVVDSAAAVLAAKAGTRTIPIVFRVGGDPVASGIVSSLNRPGGNITGISVLNVELGAKRLQILSEILRADAAVALLTNRNGANAARETEEISAAARLLGVHVLIFNATTSDDIEAAFTILEAQNVGGLITAAEPLFFQNRDRVIALATRQAIPAIYPGYPYCEAGGLMSYATDVSDGFRWTGVYTGRVLRGEKPADLPVVQPTKFQFVINLKTAKALGLTVPQSILLRADEVIE
jgi:putative ABC transport system substrate-binding protein